ncbi:IS91 family transposase, partial [Sinorhizobium meliloti]|nr:IS91 family transposase [Sinorhizobium meliloti]
QGTARKQWVSARIADLLPVPYFHVVFSLPPAVAEIAFQNKTVVYALLMRISAEHCRPSPPTPDGSAPRLASPPCFTPGSGDDPPSPCPLRRAGWRSLAGQVDVDGMSAGLLSAVRVLSRLFQRLFLTAFAKALAQGELHFFNDRAHLNDAAVFSRHLACARSIEWVVNAKPPFGGPDQVLAYLGRYTHRVAIANSRIVELDDDHVALRLSGNGCDREKIMCLHPHEFIRRFLLHLLPAGSTACVTSAFSLTVIDGCRMLLGQPSPPGGQSHSSETPRGKSYECPDCRRPMRRTGINIPPVAPPRPSSFQCGQVMMPNTRYFQKCHGR